MKTLKPLLLILALFAATASAFSISNLIKQAEVIKVTAVKSATSSAIKVQTMVRGFAANDPYAIKTLEVPKANFMSHIRGSAGGGIGGLVKRNAWYAAWFATMAAAGWAIDELHNEVSRTVAGEQLGSCVLNNSLLGSGITLPACLALVAGKGNYVLNYQAVDNTPFPPVLNRQTNFKAYVCPNGWTNTYCYYAYPYYLPGTQQPDTVQPVPDDALYDSLVNEMLKDPQKAADAFMVPDAYPYPYPNIFPSSVPYIPGVSEADQDALDLYYKGLLQSTNPTGANYVTPERYQQIADLATKLQQGQTPDGQAGQMNDQLKKPLTQAELEETLKKRDAESKKEADDVSKTDTKPVTDAYKNSKIEDEFNKLKERVTDTSKMPALPDLPASDNIDLPKYTGCKTITTNFFNATLTFPSRDQCAKLEQVKTGLGYLMYVLTALGIIMELFRRVE